MAGFRKRSYAGKMSKRPFKRARKTFTRRKRGANSIAFNNQMGVAKQIPFKSRKISKRSWNKKLWDSTLQKSHYRSNGSHVGSFNTPVSNAQSVVTRIEALDNGTAKFWQSGGGLQILDEGGGTPTFVGDIILRGGKVGLSIFNLGGVAALGAVPVKLEVFLVKNTARPVYTNIPSTVAVGWDPSIVPEFRDDVGRIIFRREIILDPQQPFTCEVRIPLQKIDQEAFDDQKRYQWIVVANDYSSSEQISCNTCAYFNLSFSADVDTDT